VGRTPRISPPPVVRRSYGYRDGAEEGGRMVEMVEEPAAGHWETTTTYGAQDGMLSATETFVPDEPGA